MTEKNTDYYRDLFYDWWPILGRESITQSDIAIAEQRLGHNLPIDYADLLMYKNGGYLQKNTSHQALINGSTSTITVILIQGVGGIGGIDQIVDGNTLNQNLINQRSYPEGSVVFAHQGSAGFAFDYENINDRGEPTILYLDGDANYRVCNYVG